MEKKVMYQTADGKCFDNADDARFHENSGRAYEDACNSQYYFYGKFEFVSDEDFAEFVCHYADMIRGG